MQKITTYLLSILFALVLVACSGPPSEGAVQTAIAQTAAAPLAEAEEPTPSAEPEEDTPTPTPKPEVECPDDEVEAYLLELDLLLEEWDDTVEIAETTSRMSLAPVVQSLQDVKREARRLERPECADYLQDLVVVGMESDISAFVAFLGQESDTVVARRMQGAEEVWATVDNELQAFQEDPLAAYLASNVSAETLEEELDQAEPFVLPEGWVDAPLPESNLIISLPEDWQHQTAGESEQYLAIDNADETMNIFLGVSPEPDFTELESDSARLFALQTSLETSDYDYYLEHSAESGVYAQNKGYVVEFSARDDAGDDIEEEVWAVIVTPQDDEILLFVSTERDEFAQIDLLTLQEIYGSIREEES